MPYAPACETSHAATAQPPDPGATRTVTPGSDAVCIGNGPKAWSRAWLAAASRGRADGPGYQHHTACGRCPVKAADRRPATPEYWAYALPSALCWTACAAWKTGITW